MCTRVCASPIAASVSYGQLRELPTAIASFLREALESGQAPSTRIRVKGLAATWTSHIAQTILDGVSTNDWFTAHDELREPC